MHQLSCCSTGRFIPKIIFSTSAVGKKHLEMGSTFECFHFLNTGLIFTQAKNFLNICVDGPLRYSVQRDACYLWCYSITVLSAMQNDQLSFFP